MYNPSFSISPESMGLLDPATSDGRVIFFLPWQKMTIAGTTDTPTDVTHHPIPSEEDINFILNEVRNYLSCDVEGNWCIPPSLFSFFYTSQPIPALTGNCHIPGVTPLHTGPARTLLYWPPLLEDLWGPNYKTMGRSCLCSPLLSAFPWNSYNSFLIVSNGRTWVMHELQTRMLSEERVKCLHRDLISGV